MELRLINTDDLLYIFDTISIINEQIKDKNIGVSKNSFYCLKKHIIEYVITLINKGLYGNNINYSILGIEKQHINNSENSKNWVFIEFSINNKTYLFHTEYRGLTMVRIVDEYIKTHTIKLSKYNKKEERLYSYTEEELKGKYINLINFMCKLNWCIYDICNNECFINMISSRYVNILIRIQNGCTFGNFEDNLIKIKVIGKKNKYTTDISLDNFRCDCHNILREIMGDKFIINYNLKTE